MKIEILNNDSDIPIGEAMLVWTNAQKVGVVRWPDTSRRSRDFVCSVGACFLGWRRSSTEQQKLQLLIEAWHIALRDLIPAEALHTAMLCIPEYRDILADDFPAEVIAS